MATGNQQTVEWRVLDDARPLARDTRSGRASIQLESQVIDSFRTDGFVLLSGVFDDWVEPLRRGLDRIAADPTGYAFPCESTAPGEPGRFLDAYCNWQRVPEFLDFVLSSPAAAVAAQLMQSSTAQLFHEHAFLKEPGTRKATPWHQDLPYYCVDGSQSASVYIALDDTSAETAIAFVPGSHRTGRTHVPRRFLDGGDYPTGDASLVSEPSPSSARIHRRSLQAGDAYVFDFRMLHGSGDAEVTTRRRAFSTRWLGDDSYYVERAGPTSPPLTGLGLEPGDRLREDWFPILWP